MKTRLLLAALVGSAAFLAQALVAEEKAEKKFEPKCPVSGKACKPDSTVEFMGKKVAFCCDNCPKAFKADSKKFAAKAAVQLLGTKQIAQVGCPYSGGKVNPDTLIDVEGVAIGFCCDKCQGKTEKADDKLAMIFGDMKNFKKGFTLQATCPVSGKPINAAQSVDYEGEKVYFCCEGCPAAFQKDPAKFASKLPQLSEKK